jgi:hypothetical protein
MIRFWCVYPFVTFSAKFHHLTQSQHFCFIALRRLILKIHAVLVVSQQENISTPRPCCFTNRWVKYILDIQAVAPELGKRVSHKNI